MAQTGSGKDRQRGPRRGIVTAALVGSIVVVAFLALVLLPGRTDAHQLTVSPGSVTSATFTVSGPSWVTVHFEPHGNAGMV